MVRLDVTNLAILSRLQDDARTSIAGLADLVGRSESAVRERLALLESEGVLVGYEARVDWAKAGLPHVALVQAACEPHEVRRLAVALQECPNVMSGWLMSGQKPILAMLRVRNPVHLTQVLMRDLAPAGLTALEASLEIATLVPRRPPPVPVGPEPSSAETTRTSAPNTDGPSPGTRMAPEGVPA